MMNQLIVFANLCENAVEASVEIADRVWLFHRRPLIWSMIFVAGIEVDAAELRSEDVADIRQRYFEILILLQT